MSDDYGISVGKIIGFAVLLVVVVISLAWLLQGSNFFMYKFFAPKQEAVRRQVFENSRAFNQGMVQELQNMQFDYTKEKDANARAALASIILHRASGYNLDDLIVPADLRSFITDLKRQQVEAR